MLKGRAVSLMIPFGEALHEQLPLTAGRGLSINSASVAILLPHTILRFVSAYTIAIAFLILFRHFISLASYNITYHKPHPLVS